ncbi:WD40 repeat domain-containing protein, partial [bacterium]|nr:WD40 repeat domain-containing protein [bacterium]
EYEMGGVILHWNGTDWSKTETSAMLFGVWGAAPDDVYVAGKLKGGSSPKGVLLHYDGNDWSTVDYGYDVEIYDVWGLAQNEVYIIGRYGAVIKWNGSEWSGFGTGISLYLDRIWGSGSDDLYVTGSDHDTDDYVVSHWNGLVWEEVYRSSYQLNHIWGSSGLDVYVASQHGNILHWDGMEWTIISTETVNNLHGIWGSGSDSFFSVGEDGVILKWDGLLWEEHSSTITHDGLGCIWGFSGDDVFVAEDGNDSTIFHWDGSLWSEINFEMDEPINDIWGTASDDIYVVSNYGKIIRYDGNAWTVVYENSPGVSIWEIWGFSSDDIFAVCDDWNNGAFIVHWNGSEWAETWGSTEVHPLGIWGADSSHVYVVGSEGTILFYDGFNWISQTSHTTENLRVVWGSGPDDVFAAGANGTILHWDGSVWASMLSNTEENIHCMWGSGPNDVLVVSNLDSSGGNQLLHWDGLEWSVSDYGSMNRISGIWGSGSEDIFLVGEGGTILRTTDEYLPHDHGAYLDLNQSNFHPRDQFYLSAKAVNGRSFTPVINGNLYVMLDPGIGEYWFWPGWAHWPSDIDFVSISLAYGETDFFQVLDFTWPETGDMQISHINFWAV